MNHLDVTIRSIVYPTEDQEKVKKAIKNLMGDISLKTLNEGDVTFIKGREKGLESLRQLRNTIGRARIRSATRALFERIAEENLLSFGLNKLAAFSGHVSFYDSHSPLGPIQITMKGNITEAIQYLCGE